MSRPTPPSERLRMPEKIEREWRRQARREAALSILTLIVSFGVPSAGFYGLYLWSPYALNVVAAAVGCIGMPAALILQILAHKREAQTHWTAKLPEPTPDHIVDEQNIAEKR